MQASTAWQPPVGTLGEILAETRARIASIEAGARTTGGVRAGAPSLAGALRRDTVAVIAEVKRRSPSRGAINPSLDAATQASSYEAGGASAISILTEPHRFGGSLDDLRQAASVTGLPLLKKDFHISPAQIHEAAQSGASAVLLIARALPPDELRRLAALARELGLEPVIEVRTEMELDAALSARAEIIGVNSRDLETLEVDERVPERIVPKVPAGLVAVWESGVRGLADVRRAAAAGADAVLVGSVLSATPQPGALLRELVTVPRRSR